MIRENNKSNTQGHIQMEISDVRQDALLASERGTNGDEKDVYFLEGGGILSCCLGFHPILKCPPSLEFINKVTSILDRDRTLLSGLTMSTAQQLVALEAVRQYNTLLRTQGAATCPAL
jgi:hypothetical protein